MLCKLKLQTNSNLTTHKTHLSKVDAADESVDLVIVVVVREDEKRPLDLARLRKRHYQVPEVCEAGVDLGAKRGRNMRIRI